jgi:hypothetical protein
MGGKQNSQEKDKPATIPARLGESRLEPSGEVVVARKKAPSRPPENKKIHPRRPMPLVPESSAEPSEQPPGPSPPRSGEQNPKK